MRLKRGKYCPVGYVEITDLVDGRDVLWDSSQPTGELAQSLSQGAYESRRIQAALDVLSERLDDLYDRRAIEPAQLDDRLELLERVEDLDLRFVHTGPGLMGDDYTPHICAKLRGK